MHKHKTGNLVEDFKAPFSTKSLLKRAYIIVHMKKLFTLLTAFCVCTTTFAQVLYTLDFTTATEADVASWTIIDANEDEKTWEYDSYASPSRVFYSYHSSNVADDWMISPAITSPQSGTAIISFGVVGSPYTEKVELFYGNQPTVEAMTNKMSETLTLNNKETSCVYLVNVEANKPIYFGFHACSDANTWRLYLKQVKVIFTNNPVDIKVTEIISPTTDFNLSQETVAVKVENVGVVDVNGFSLSYSVDGGTVVTENVNQVLAKGAQMIYTFTAKADLSTPRKSFAIKSWTSHDDDVDTSNDTTSISVLHRTIATVPYTMGFEATEYTDDIVFFNLNEDDGTWDLYSDKWGNLARTGDYCLEYNYNRYNDAEDWAILEPIEIKEAGYYVLKFWYAGDDDLPEKLGVYYGNERLPSEMTNKIVEYAPFACSTYEESINIIHIDKPQTIYIGFYAFSDKDQNSLCVDDVSFDKIDATSIDLGVNEITNPSEYVHKGSKLDVEFSVRNFGITDVPCTVKVKIDDTVVKEENTTINALKIIQFTDADALKSLSAGVHNLTVEVVAENDNVSANNTKTVEFRVMGTPVLRWDFEDNILPKDFTFRVEDEGTVNPSAGSEFNEAGWGLLNITSHEQFGEHILAGTSWLDGTEEADRWCILPPFIAGENTYLVWDAASFNPNFLESYSIMVSSNGDDCSNFDHEMGISIESSDFKTRGVDLSSYSGEEIYVAFRLRSKNCEHLTLDNIDIYGDIITAVEEVGEAKMQVKMENGIIKVVGAEVYTLEIFDMNGRCVINVTDNEILAKKLNAGVYIVRATTANEVINQKVIIR